MEMVFLIVSAGLFALSVIAVLWAGWRWNFLDFLRFYVFRFFIGELTTGIFGLNIFVLFAITLTQWLPDGLENGDAMFSTATVLYFLSMLFFTGWVYPPGRGKQQGTDTVRYIVYPLSKPNYTPEVFEDLDICKKLDGNCTLREGILPNINPLYFYLRKSCGEGCFIEGIFLLLSDKVMKGFYETDGIELLTFFDTVSSCIESKYNVKVCFDVHFEEIGINAPSHTRPEGCGKKNRRLPHQNRECL